MLFATANLAWCFTFSFSSLVHFATVEAFKFPLTIILSLVLTFLVLIVAAVVGFVALSSAHLARL